MASGFGAWFDELKKEEAAKQNGDVEEGAGLLAGFLPSKWLPGLEKKTDGEGGAGAAIPNPKEFFQGLYANIKGASKPPNSEADQLVMGMSYKRRFQLFVATLLLSVLFFGLAFVIGLPTLVLRPHKFALCFTLGSLMFMGSFAMLKGPSAQLKSMIAKDRIPFTLLYLISMLLTLYACLGMRSYILAIICSGFQMTALVWYLVTFIPGGSNGMKYFINAMVRTAKYLILPCLKATMKTCQLCCKGFGKQ